MPLTAADELDDAELETLTDERANSDGDWVIDGDPDAESDADNEAVEETDLDDAGE